MDKSIKDKFLACRSYEEAKPILETQGVGITAHDHTRLAFSIQGKQPTIASQMFNTVIQEMEDDEEHKKIEEVDGGSSEQSSSTTGLEKVGSESDAAESFHAQADKKDQMGVAINEMGGYPPGQMPPPNGMPQQQMNGGQCGQQPPPMQPQQQMQYTIQEVQRQGAVLKSIQEAIKQLDKKIQETQKEQPNSLDIGSNMGHKKSLAVIKETTGDKTQDLESTRQEIKRMNDHLNSGKF